jgi:dihydrofolate synthase/folylpolyglutamate synthase
LLRERDFGVRNNVFAIGGRVVDLYTPDAGYPEVFLALHGAHQGDNAAIALAAAEAFVNTPVPRDVVVEAYATVQSPGRLEVARRGPLVLLDGAHNVAGAEALRRALDEEFGDGGARTMIVGMNQERDPHEMLAALGVDQIEGLLIATRASSPRALDPSFVAKAAIELGVEEDRVEVTETVTEAVSTALLASPEDGQIVVTGSLYVVGAARTMFFH